MSETRVMIKGAKISADDSLDLVRYGDAYMIERKNFIGECTTIYVVKEKTRETSHRMACERFEELYTALTMPDVPKLF